MKNSFIMSAALSVTALVSSASAARFYVQPSIAVAEISGFDSTVGSSLAAGAQFAGKHLVEIDASRFSFEDGIRDPFFSYSTDIDLTPLLLSYRYEFPISEKLFGSVGAMAGVTLQKVAAQYTYASPPFFSSTSRFERKDESFTVGFQASVGYRFNDHFAAVLAAKSLRIDDSDVMGNNSATVIQLGLNCRF